MLWFHGSEGTNSAFEDWCEGWEARKDWRAAKIHPYVLPLCSTEFPNKPKKRKAHFDVDDDGFINDDNGFVRDGFAKNEVGGSEGDRNAPGSGDKVKTPVLGRSLYQTMSTSNDVKINSSPKAIDGQRYPCPAWVVCDLSWGGAGQWPQREQSPVEHRGNLSIHPSVRPSVLPSSPNPSKMAQI